MISAPLRDAYARARYVIRDWPGAGNVLTLGVGVRSEALAKAMDSSGVDAIAILTAWNPALGPQGNNHSAQAALEADARGSGLRIVHGWNADAGSDSHMEPTVILLDADLKLGNALARRYGQLAWVYADRRAVPELVWMD